MAGAGLCVPTLSQNQLPNVLGIRNSADRFGPFHRGGRGNCDGPNASETVEKTLIYINGADVSGKEVLITLCEQTALQSDAV